jgi:hypothetical protein
LFFSKGKSLNKYLEIVEKTSIDADIPYGGALLHKSAFG